ncbi:sensor histidine kinase [Campylobacter majalis]|uniref:sensor histidine kinase n=1 Tax=Campylobacter majalis TaxID=2790656 RepID=UPI003D68C1D1
MLDLVILSKQGEIKAMLSKLKNIEISHKITLWYSVFMLILVIITIGLSLFIANKVAKYETHKKLINKVEQISHDINKYEEYDDGVFLIILQRQKGVIKGQYPKNFDPKQRFSGSKIGFYENNKTKFYYYDRPIKKQKDTIIRAIILADNTQSILGSLFFAIALIAPILFVIAIFVGYKLAKNALAPINQISKTAQTISQSADFSKRVKTSNNNDELAKLSSVINEMLQTLQIKFQNEKQLTSDISHELKTPISVILSQAQYAIQHADTLDEAKQCLQVIQKQSKKMAELTNQILQISKIENLTNIKMKRVCLSEILQSILNDFDKISNKKLITKIDPNIHINADITLLERAINNILDNALKFSRSKIEVNLKIDNNVAKLSIKDDGEGIEKDEFDKIFNKFYQIETSRNKLQNSGNGLGLFMSAQIIRLHNAKITINSELKRYSEFCIEFLIN